MFSEKLEKIEQFSTIRYSDVFADQMKTLNLLEMNYNIFQQKLGELQEAYKELDEYEMKYNELISSSSSVDQLMLQIIKMTIKHIDKCHKEYLNKNNKNSNFGKKSFMIFEEFYEKFIYLLKIFGNWIKSIIYKFDELFFNKSSPPPPPSKRQSISSIKPLHIKLFKENLKHHRNYSNSSTSTTPITTATTASFSFSSLDDDSLLTPTTTVDNDFLNDYDGCDNDYDDEIISQNIFYVDIVLQSLKLEYLLNLRFYKIFVDQMLFLQNLDLGQNNNHSFTSLIDDITEGYRTIIDSFESLEDKISCEKCLTDQESDSSFVKNIFHRNKLDKLKYSKLTSEFVGFTPADWYLMVLIDVTGKYINDKIDSYLILDESGSFSSQVEEIKDLFNEIERLNYLIKD
nr:14696_t:CDS:1 [Entrophospora candida]